MSAAHQEASFQIHLTKSEGSDKYDLLSIVQIHHFAINMKNILTKAIVENYIQKIKNKDSESFLDYHDPVDARIFLSYTANVDKCMISFHTNDLSCVTQTDPNLITFNADFLIENADMLRELEKILPLLS